MKARSNSMRMAAVLALTLVPTLARAQHTAEDLRKAAAGMDCRQLARMSNPPMSVEACEAQKLAFGNLGAAAAMPGGERPGDGTMDCDQISAELQSGGFSGVGEATAAEGVEAGEALRAAQASSMATATGLAARQALETAASAGGPNAVQGAVAARHAVEQEALRRSAVAQVRPSQERTTMANAASAQELAENLQANPRFATLLQLAMARNCQMP